MKLQSQHNSYQTYSMKNIQISINFFHKLFSNKINKIRLCILFNGKNIETTILQIFKLIQMQEQLSDIDQQGQKVKPVTEVFNQQPNNDNNETVMLKVNGDMQDSRKIWTLRIIVGSTIILIFFLHFALPQTFTKISNETAFPTSPSCNPSLINQTTHQIECQKFTLELPSVGLYLPQVQLENQFILYHFSIYVDESMRDQVKVSQDVQIVIYEVNNTGQEMYAGNIVYNNTQLFQIKGLRKYQGKKQDTGLWKYRISFAYDRIDEKQNQDYLIVVKFLDPSQLIQIKIITLDVIVFVSQALVVNPNYTIFTIVIRAIFCLASLITAIVFLRRYCQLKKQDRIVQMQLIASASVFLILFNDPFFAITILKVNMISTFFSCFVVINMLVCLNVLWMFVLRRIYSEPMQKKSTLLTLKRSWPFYLVIIALNIAISVFSNQYSFYILKKIPVITSQDFDNMKVIGSIIAIVLIMGAIIIYQIVMYVRIIRKNCGVEEEEEGGGRQDHSDNGQANRGCNGNWYGFNRHMNFMFYYPFFVVMFVVLFAAGSLLPFSLEGTWVLYGICFINIYIFLLQYLYYTPKSQLQKAQPLILNQKLSNNNNNSESKNPTETQQPQKNHKQVSIELQSNQNPASDFDQNKNQ